MTLSEIFTPVLVLVMGAAAVQTVAAPGSALSRSPIEDRPRIVAFGDSLTSGLGVAANEAYPAQLQRRLEAEGYRYLVINAGVSGDTTAGGLRRVTWALQSKPEIVILELGANDGLRGLSLDETRMNLERIIEQFQQASVTVVLAGMKLPPNYGAEYTAGFEAIYPALARKYGLRLIPFFLERVAGSAALNQADGIHPTGEGYRVIAEKILQTLRPVLRKARHEGNGRGGKMGSRPCQAPWSVDSGT